MTAVSEKDAVICIHDDSVSLRKGKVLSKMVTE